MTRHKKRRLGRKHKHGAEVPTHALNDIMFFLLLFFLIISTLSPPDPRPVETPESNSSLQNTKKTTNLTITENKEFFFEDKPIKMEELDAKFEEVAQKEETTKEEQGISLTIDRKLKVSDIVDIIRIAQRHKVRLYVKTTKKFT